MRDRDRLKEHELLPKMQSGFRKNHSTETALMKVMSDILMAADGGNVTLLSLLDMSAAFDTVDHDILLDRLSTSFGFRGSVLSWVESFLRGRTQKVVYGDASSSTTIVQCGVPQGSVLGPLLFLLYTADIPIIINKFGLGVHIYADDTQLYIHGMAGAASLLSATTVSCIAEVERWMMSNRLKLNADKTQLVWLGTWQQLRRMSEVCELSVHIGSSIVSPQSVVSDLGVMLDSTMRMKEHVAKICRSSYFQLRQLRAIRRSLTFTACNSLVHAFITCRLDYCNGLLYGVSGELIHRLYSIQRAAARLVLRKKKYDQITDDMRDQLHWLPVCQRIDFKICLLVYKCLHGLAPPYLVEMLRPISSDPLRRHLRSAAHGDLMVPGTRTNRLGPRAFVVAGPTLWNRLPANLRNAALSIGSFKEKLKKHFYDIAYPLQAPS